jgi:hypothetical protein
MLMANVASGAPQKNDIHRILAKLLNVVELLCVWSWCVQQISVVCGRTSV